MVKACPYCRGIRLTKSGEQKNTKDHSVHQRYRCQTVGCLKYSIDSKLIDIEDGIKRSDPSTAPAVNIITREASKHQRKGAKTAISKALPPVDGEEDTSF